MNVFADVYYTGSEVPLFIERIESKNLVVNTGRNIIRNIMAEPDSDTRASFLNIYFYWGSGTDVATAGETALVTPSTYDSGNPQAITEANISTDYQITYKYYMPSSEANSETIAEAGLFFGNLAGSTTMFARVKLGSAIEKTADKAITFSWIQAITATS